MCSFAFSPSDSWGTPLSQPAITWPLSSRISSVQPEKLERDIHSDLALERLASGYRAIELLASVLERPHVVDRDVVAFLGKSSSVPS